MGCDWTTAAVCAAGVSAEATSVVGLVGRESSLTARPPLTPSASWYHPRVKSRAAFVAPRVEGSDAHPLVDPTLIDATLALTPEERLRQNDRMLQTIQELRDGFATRRPDDAAVETSRRED